MLDTQEALRTLRSFSDNANQNAEDCHGELRLHTLPASMTDKGAFYSNQSVDLNKIIIGDSPAMREIRSTIAEVAGTRAAVMVLGESGTEKEQIARAIHSLSGMAGGPFIPVSMATISADAVETQLFGDEREPLARNDKQIGYCELAEGGTLFLDEISELELQIQPPLLRFLQTGVIHPFGARHPKIVDARVITATNCDPASLVEQKRLCEDLYFRLHVVPIRVPALRERVEDIGELAQCFLDRFANRHSRKVEGFTDEVIDCFHRHPWPGNVRQLEYVVERAVIFAKAPLIRPLDLPPEILASAATASGASSPRNVGQPSSDPGVITRLKPIQQKERAAIIESLEQTDGHVVEAAELLGLSQATMYRKIKEYQIVRQRKRRKSKPR